MHHTRIGWSPSWRELAYAQRSLVEALAGPSPLDSLLSRLHSVMGRPVAVVDRRGGLVLSRPTRAEWPIKHLEGLDWTEVVSVSRYTALPVSVDGEPTAFLCVEGEIEDLAVLEVAGVLVGVELSRRNAELRGRRELLGDVLTDLFAGQAGEVEATRALSRHGYTPGVRYRVIVGQVNCSQQRLRASPWNLHSLVADTGDSYMRAVLEDWVVLIAPDEASDQLARLCHDHLHRLGPDVRVGIGGPQVGALGLKLSHFEAKVAASTGEGVRRFGVEDLTATLLGAALETDTQVVELSRRLLAPLVEHDMQHGTSLLATLETYLSTGCSSAETSAHLFIHRNTLRYRLGLIEKVTGRSLQVADTRLHLWLAIRIWRMGPSFGVSTIDPQDER